MKDVQGIQRGKCNSCECIEYRAPEESGRYRCDYCNHTPAEHVRIVELGACKQSDCDCDQYSSEDPNSYTDCQYCGCSASQHEGAQTLRKAPARPQQPPPPTSAGTAPIATVMAGQMYPGAQAVGKPAGAMTALLSTAPLLPDHLRCKYPICNRKRYQESNGKKHEFCGRTHALEYQRLAQKGSHVSANMKCKTPQCTLARKPRDDGEGYYDYCSITCRDGGSRLFHSPSEPNLAHGDTCSLPGCTRPRYVDPANGRVHDFCGRTHANEAHARGITANSCNLTLVSTSSQEFVQVQALFQRTWARKKGNCPAITCVFLITNLQLEARWERYKTQLPVQTVEQYYHGTKLTCDIVNQRTACTDSNCGVCGISRMGMDRQCMRQNIKFQRFGRGFYFAPNSSKCHDYTQGVHIHRAMLQCDILPGKKHTLTQGDQKLTGPPPGFHSVYGQTGDALNYEELVVYNPDCVMPHYIIVYQRDGVHQIAK